MASFWVQKMAHAYNPGSNKMIVWGKWTILDLECHILPHNSGSAISIVLQFSTIKGAKRDMEI